MQTMTVVRNNLQQQLRVMHLQKYLDEEKYEKLLQNANQCTVIIDTDEENENFIRLPRRATSKLNRAAGNS